MTGKLLCTLSSRTMIGYFDQDTSVSIFASSLFPFNVGYILRIDPPNHSDLGKSLERTFRL